MFNCRHFQPENMAGSVADNSSAVNDQQRLDTIRYHQTVPTDATGYHQYHQYHHYHQDVNQNKSLPPPQFPILQLPQHLGNITAATIKHSYNIYHISPPIVHSQPCQP